MGRLHKKLELLIISTLVLSGCEFRITDKNGDTTQYSFAKEIVSLENQKTIEKIESIKEKTESTSGYGYLVAITKRISIGSRCENKNGDSYVAVLAASTLMQYIRNGYSNVKREDIEHAHSILVTCAKAPAKNLVTEVYLGLGMHGQGADAKLIVDSFDARQDAEMIPAAAMSLSLICDPIADSYIEHLGRTTAERRYDGVIAEARANAKHSRRECELRPFVQVE